MPSASASYTIDPPHAPFPTCRYLPFHTESGSHTSDLMSESADGLSVSATRQNGGRLATAGPVAGVKRPPATTLAVVTEVLGSLSDSARRSQDAACTAGVCANAADDINTHNAARGPFIVILRYCVSL